MALLGHCQCNNFQITWHTIDYSLVPRACSCDYCQDHSAAYVSKSGSQVEVRILKPHFHRTVQQGSHLATFHECSHCQQLVCVSALIEGEQYGALNAAVIANQDAFSATVTCHPETLTPEQKQRRWQQNWSQLVLHT